MIPLKLHIAGFLSYKNAVEIDFTTFDLACISGPNGAGKSSLLDAITWALFGQARKRDDSVINLQSKAAEVSLEFEYEGNRFRVQRTLPRNKPTVLEFQVWDAQAWRALTERTLRETQARVEQALRLDYDTFINASFFLQGKADQFTQQTASKRKDVLGNILGLEVWEVYKERTAGRRRDLEAQAGQIDGRMSEISSELADEQPRKAHLARLETQLSGLASARAAQEAALESVRRLAATLKEQRRLKDTLGLNLERSRVGLRALEQRRTAKEQELASYIDLTRRTHEIEAAYQAWLAAREGLRRLDEIAAQFREHDEKRQPLLREIEAEKARLVQECESLQAQSVELQKQLSARAELEVQIEEAGQRLADAEARAEERLELDRQILDSHKQQLELKAGNERLRKEMAELKERIDKLEVAEGAACPLCGQSLTEEHRASTLQDLRSEGRAKGDAYRSNLAASRELDEQVDALQARINLLMPADQQRLAAAHAVSQLSERLDNLEQRAREWEKTGARRLAELSAILEGEKFALPTRKALAKLDKELVKLGYDAAAHDRARLAEHEAQISEVEFRKLETALEVSRQIETALQALLGDMAARQAEIQEQQRQFDEVAAALAVAEAQAPDLYAAEEQLLRVREQENQVRDEVGAARQKVEILDILRARNAEYLAQRDELNRSIDRHKTLERAFGKDGVPALLIEQALPQIEMKANELLERLSDGQMSIRFVTQAEYKDKKRGDLRETLDILISDGAGLRDYEMYSGGEAFRVNFAIRLALSEVLAQRKGARLQTLVIDEGFGSQDTRGRQRLVEAINLVKNDFAKILVITHLDELKDAFPTRIEVEKTDQGSTVSVV
jgi:exonuclease SbcC